MVLDGTLAALFIAGLASGLHCAGMCGGIVMMMSGVGRHRGAARAPGAARSHAAAAPGLATFALADIGRAGSSVQTLRRPSAAAALLEGQPAMLLFNAGRIGSYALAGALAGGIGSFGWIVAHMLPVQQAAFIVTNLALLLLGLSLAGVGAPARLLDAAGSRWLGAPWRRLQALVLTPFGDRPARAFASGLAWGWVPCAMVYSVLLTALVSGSAGRGAAQMAAFGLGTLPNLLGMDWLLRRSPRSARWLRPLSAIVIIGFALAGFARIDPLASALAQLCISPWQR